MPRPNGTHHEYRPDIDGLRAVAVLSVVAFHAFPEFVPGGFVGVDIFFVISGFLISGIIFEGLDTGTFSLAEFYRRRVRRIFPALTIVLLACLVAGWFTLLPDEYEQLAEHTVAGAGFLSNVELWKEAGYFDTSSDHKPLLHLWSLGIEEQFYLVWPACLLLLWKRKRNVMGAVALLAALSFGINVLRVHAHTSSTFYLPVTRFWELLLGCLLAHYTLFTSGRAGARKTASNAAANLGLAAIAIAIILLNRDRDFPGWWALLPTVGSALLIWAGPDAWINRTILRNPAMVLIGLVSYPLYLWHWPLLSFARIVATPTKTLRLILVAASIVLAWGTWKYLETNIRRRSNWIGARANTFALSTGLGLCCLLGATVILSHGFVARFQPESLSLWGDVAAGPSLSGVVACAAHLPNLNLCAQSKAGPANAAVVGDSHAESLFRGIAASDPGRTWLLIGNRSCPPTLGIAVEDEMAMCADKMKQAFDYLIAKGPDIVVLAFYGYYAESTDFAADHLSNRLGPSHVALQGELRQGPKEEALFDGLAKAIQLLIQHKKRVFLFIDVPELPFLPRDCITRAAFTKETDCSVGRAVVDRRQQGLRRLVKRLQQSFPEINVFDPLPLLCDRSRCRPVFPGFSYYQDSHHLSLRGSAAVAGSLVALINQSESSR